MLPVYFTFHMIKNFNFYNLYNFQILNFSVNDNKANLIFYGDKTLAKMFKTTLMPFDEGIKTFREGPRLLLNKAVREALFEMHQQKKKVD